MKKIYFSIFTLLLVVLAFNFSQAQVFTGDWSTEYVTDDNAANGTGYQTIAVGPIADNNFVALVNHQESDAANHSYYIVGYKNADSSNGRMWTVEYAPKGLLTSWSQGFTRIDLLDANDLDATPASLVFVANNDAQNNILVFELTDTELLPTQYKLATQNGYQWAIDTDADGRVYVTKIDTAANQSSVAVYDNFANEPFWTNYFSAPPTPLTEIILPDPGEARGIAVSEDGSSIWVSNWDSKKVYKYVGDPVNGYTPDNGFSLITDGIYYSPVPDTFAVGPYGMEYIDSKGILCLANDSDFGNDYEYGRIYLANSETGSIEDTINVAEWNYSVEGSYANHSTGIASGYTSTYDVAVDPDLNVYSQSFYGWTVEKWVYSETLPVLTDIKEISGLVPDEFSLSQNYPNPFNPSTSIEFSINELSNVSLDIYTITGELVGSLISGKEFAAGTYKVSFDASRLSSGIYLYSLRAGNNTLTRKMTLIK
ncbi:MAG: T9SS type A sorting domain-containing protein [Ignavibacteriae bacterium]|jgi:hypothetical protein|nr:T9SS C-terminal target domain-containing protein [Ignavibacteriota bacterium]NOG98766.1 T9SS type A sorting domain-containing protein [Ignavibacteriota bacterium]